MNTLSAACGGEHTQQEAEAFGRTAAIFYCLALRDSANVLRPQDA